MAATDDAQQTRFRVDLTGPQGRVVSSQRTDSEEEAVRAFATLAKTDFGKDLGRGANVALVDSERRLDAAKVAEGNGVYNLRFLREEGRAAYEAVQPSPPGIRYPVDLPDKRLEPTFERPRELPEVSTTAGSSDRTDPDRLASDRSMGSSIRRNEMEAHRAQPDDNAGTASLRKRILDGLTTWKPEPGTRRANDYIQQRDGTPSRRSSEPLSIGGNLEFARAVLSSASEAELMAFVTARKYSPEAAQQALGAAQKRIEAEFETPSGVQRRALPPVEDRFNVVNGAGVRTYQFRDQPEEVAFTERWLSMATGLDSAAVVKAMVDRAEERGWTGMRLAGSEKFKRQAWIAADARGLKAVGYEPTQGDLAASRQEAIRLTKEQPDRTLQQEAGAGGTMTRQGARTQADPPARGQEDGRESARQPVRGTPSREYAPVMGELERAMNLKGVPEAQRASARNAVQKALDGLAQKDKTVKVKLYDPAASREAPRAVTRRQPQRAEPDRAR